jgi:rSAM/selenodomain-associated transferase 1
MNKSNYSDSYALMLFTKYPKANKVKTRLIPAIGAENAVILHKILTEKTLTTLNNVKKLLNKTGKLKSDIFIFFDGCEEINMRDWLGSDFYYVMQNGHDLGERMKNAFDYVFKKSYKKAVIVGSDCPDLNTDIVDDAFNNLDNYDAVFGKALDGGYYLIALKKVIPKIFVDIRWSTPEVLEKTLNICNNHNHRYFLTKTLSDIDTIDDLKKFPEILSNL